MQLHEYLDPEIETMEPRLLEELQEERLAKQLEYLFARSPFYQDKFRTAGIRPEHFRSLADLVNFPFTAKEELRESQTVCPPLGRHMAVEMTDVIRIHSSTGTTGRPSFVGVTRADAEGWNRLTARSFYTQGLRPSDIVIHAASLTLFAGEIGRAHV